MRAGKRWLAFVAFAGRPLPSGRVGGGALLPGRRPSEGAGWPVARAAKSFPI